MFRPRYPDLVKPDYEAAFKLHIRLVASITCLLGFGICLLVAPFAAIEGAQCIVPFVVLVFVISIGLLVADKYELPSAYLPYLIIVTGFLFVGVAIVAALVIFALFRPVAMSTVLSDYFPHLAAQVEEEGFFFLAAVLLCAVGAEVLGIYCWNVVKRARRYMIDEVCSGKVERNFRVIQCHDSNANACEDSLRRGKQTWHLC